MAERNYLSNPNNSFFAVEDDDVDDDTFLRNSRQAQAQKLKEIEDRALRSAQASISILRETEDIGVKTAEELMVQREKLERTEKNLDEINTTLRFSQKHINGIKSVFGSFKNYLSGRGDPKPGQSDQTGASGTKENAESSSSYSGSASRKLTSALETKPETKGTHPALRIRGLSDEDDDEVPAMRSSDSLNPLQSRYNQVNDILDKNIEEVGSSLSRLKGLAEGLGEELDLQNDMIGRIHDKTDRADVNISRQNREMKRILK